MALVRLVARRPGYLTLGLASFVELALLYLWSSQVLSVGAHGVSLFIQPPFVAAALLMSFLFGLVVPLQVYAFRLATVSAGTGRTALGAILGASSMTCCAPVLLPSVLSLIGFSGVTILSVNAILSRFWAPLATLSVILLIWALISVVRSLGRTCTLDAESSAGR
jgi:hypothetical protein